MTDMVPRQSIQESAAKVGRGAAGFAQGRGGRGRLPLASGAPR